MWLAIVASKTVGSVQKTATLSFGVKPQALSDADKSETSTTIPPPAVVGRAAGVVVVFGLAELVADVVGVGVGLAVGRGVRFGVPLASAALDPARTSFTMPSN